MEVKATRSEGLDREYEFVVPGKEIREKRDGTLEEIRSTIQLRGFRPGKAPMSIIRRRFSDAALTDTVNDRVKTEVESILESNEEVPVGNPDIDVSDPDGDEGDYRVKVAYECMPAIPDVEFASLVVKRPVISSEENTVAAAIEADARLRSPFGETEAGRASRPGDKVVISLVATVDGKEFPGSRSDEMEFVVRDDEDQERTRLLSVKYGVTPPLYSQKEIDQFAILGGVLGMKAGDTADFEFDVPDEPHFEHAAGKRASGEIKLLQVLPMQPLEPEAFAEHMGYGGLKELEEHVARSIRERYERYARDLMVYDLNSQIDRQLDFDVPRSMASEEIENLKSMQEAKDAEEGEPAPDASATESELGPDGPATESESAQDGAAEGGTGADGDEERLRLVATRRLRRSLFYSDIRRKHGIEVDDEGLRQFVLKTMGPYYGRLSAERFRKDKVYEQEVRLRAVVEKINDFMLELVAIEDEVCSSGDIAERFDRLSNVDVFERFGFPDESLEVEG